jgi:hypothetical protein
MIRGSQQDLPKIKIKFIPKENVSLKYLGYILN